MLLNNILLQYFVYNEKYRHLSIAPTVEFFLKSSLNKC